MRISDWSSDGCSSDLGRKDGVVDLDLHDVLVAGHRPVGPVGAPGAVMHRILVAQTREAGAPGVVPIDLWIADVDAVDRDRGDRKGVVYGKNVSVRVDLGGRLLRKQKRQPR